MKDLKESNLISSLLKKDILNGNIQNVITWLSKSDNTKNLNLTDENGNSILHLAVKSKNPSMIQLVLRVATNLDLTKLNKENKTAFQIALENEKNYFSFVEWKCVLAFLNACKDPISQGFDALIEAVDRDNVEMTAKLLKVGVSANKSSATGEYPIHTACRKGYDKIIGLLLEPTEDSTPTDVSVTNKEGKTPLEIALDKEKDHLLQDWKMVKTFITKGPKGQEQSRFHYALCEAIVRNNIKMIKFCLSNGVSVDFPDKDGNYPLHIAAQNGQHAITSLLLRRHPNTNKQNSNGKTPLQIAADNAKEKGWQGVLAIVDHLIHLMENNNHSDQIEIFEAFYKENVAHLKYAIHAAINQGTHEMVATLLNKLQKTVYLYHRIDSAFPLSKVMSSLQNICDSAHFLHLAVQNPNSQEIILLLLRYHADPTKKNNDGKTPIEIAVDNSHKDGWQYVHVLISHLVNKVRNHYSDEQKFKQIYINQLLYALNTAVQTAQPASMLEHLQNSLLADPISCFRNHLEELVTAYVKKWQESDNPDDIKRELKQVYRAASYLLFSAAQNPNPNVTLPFIKHLLSYDVDITLKDKHGKTSVHIMADLSNWEGILAVAETESNIVGYALAKAAQVGKWDIVRTLLELGVNPNIPDEFGNVALHYATEANNAEIVTLLLSKNADSTLISTAKKVDGSRKTAIEIAATNINTNGGKCFFAFLEHRAYLAKWGYFDYAIAAASSHNRIDIVRTLLRMGANPNNQSYVYKYALHFAVTDGDLDTVELLLDYKADVTLKTTHKDKAEQKTAIDLAADNLLSDDGRCLSFFIEQYEYLIKSGYFDYALTCAVFFDKTDIIKTLLSKGASPNKASYQGKYPLHIAAQNGNLDILNLLLEHNADVELLTDDQSNNAITLAVIQSHWDCVKTLVDNAHKASYSCIWALCKATEQENTALVKEFISLGVSVLPASVYNLNPLYTAVEKNNAELIELFIKKGADITKTGSEHRAGLPPVVTAAIKVFYDDIIKNWDCVLAFANNQRDDTGEAGYDFALRLAVLDNNVQVAAALLKAGADPNQIRFSNKDPQYQAKFSDADFKFSAHFQTGNTALHDAAKKGNDKMVKLLLSHGANKKAVNKQNDKPLDLATDKDCISTLQGLASVIAKQHASAWSNPDQTSNNFNLDNDF